MQDRANAFARHQQARWLSPDAARWVRPDALSFVRPGTDVADVYPALALQRDALQHEHDREIADAIAQQRTVLAALREELAEINAELERHRAEQKYNEDQPRVAAGNSDGGQWTSGGGGSGRPRVYITGRNPDNEEIDDGGFGLSLPLGLIDFGDIAREIDRLDLFDLKPRKPRSGGVRLAGKPPERLPPIVVRPDKPSPPGTPGIGHNGGPPLNPPKIPKRMPDTTEKRMGFVREAARWIARAGSRTFAVDIFLGALDQVNDLKRLTDMIKTANDPPRTIEELQEPIGSPSEAGLQDHHLVNQHRGNRDKFGDDRIDSRLNQARIPTVKHLDISGWYSRPNDKFGGLSPRDYLRDKDWDYQMRVGLDVLRQHGVLK